MRIEWIQIVNARQDDKRYIVDGIGEVFVHDSDIDTAQKLGGNPHVELSDASSSDATIPQYVISRFIPRNTDSQQVSKRDNLRLLALRRIYEATHGNTQVTASWPDIAKKAEWAEAEANDALFFLRDRGLIELRRFGPHVALTRAGVDEVEQAIRNPDSHTHFFSAPAVQFIHNIMDNSNRSVNINNSTVGATVTGNSSIAHVNQQTNPQLCEALGILGAIREEIKSLPDDRREEAEDLCDSIDAEVNSEKPSKSRLKAFCGELENYVKAAGLAMQIFLLTQGKS